MKKHYNTTNWLSLLYRGVLMSASLLFISGMAMAQLNGSYTINSGAATGGTNFNSFADLTDTLGKAGVSGPVTVTVESGSGPYKEKVTLKQYSGVSSKNTITINGNGETVLNTGSSSVFYFDGADYITLNKLVIETQGTGTGTRCIHLRGGADYNKVENCELIMSKYTGTSNSTQYVCFSGSTTSYSSSGSHGSYNVFDNNKMWNGGNKGAGPYHGISDYRSSSYTNTGFNKYTNNEIMNAYYYSMYFYYVGGVQVVKNNIHDCRSDATYYYPMYYYRGQGDATNPILINDNKVHSNSPQYYFYYGLYAYYCSGSSQETFQMNNNEVYNNSAGYYLYGGVSPYYCTNVQAKNNDIHNNSAGYYVYGMYAYYSTNALIESNAIRNNSAQYGVYGMYAYYLDGEIINNTYYGNTGDYYNYAILCGYTQTSLNICHNTFIMDDDVDYYNYALYAYMYYSFTNINVKNNLLYITAKAGYYNYVVYAPYNYKDMNFENNDLYVNSSSTNYYYTNGQNTTLAAFNNSVGNNTNISVDPKFTDLAKGNIIPTNPAIANYGQPGYAKYDFAKVTRTACGPDVGAFEFYVDHNASDLVFTGKKECGGYMEPIKFTFNNGSSVDLEDASVYYTINGGKPVVEQISVVKANSSYDYTFSAVPEFHKPGTNTIEVGLLCDDNTSNNTLTTTIDITPSPHSFDLSEGAGYEGYFNTGGKTSPDVTVPGKKAEYIIENPAKYPNADHKKDWIIRAQATTENGTDVTAGLTLTDPSSSGKGVLTYDPDPAMADSLISLCLTITDYGTGCDSTICRWIYVPHTPKVAWESTGGCDGDVVSFVNGTKQETGATEYSWTFGDPNSGEDNTSEISDPVHRFTAYGTYDVTVNAWNFDYPKFVYTLSKQVVVDPVPSVDFQVINACEGKDIEFKNNTSLPSGVSGTVDYTWNFGDGSATSAMENPKHQYSKAGGFKVTLTANLKGCAASITKNANQFATPTADFSVSGKCNLEEIEFMNASTISLGRTGHKWNFNDGSVSNLSNPKHAFATPGDHTVKLVTISEFGCMDEVEKTFTLNESPRADFSYTDACSNTPVEFTREGSLPSGANSIFEWDFDGEMTSTKENDSHQFSTVGVKNVSLKVSSDNGCSDMISKEFVVKLQAKADFVATDVCEGEDVVFTNKSSVASGNLNYQWRFGDAESSDLTSPRHNYELATAGVTESFQVTLLALVPGGCSDSIARTVTVNASADPSFDAKTNWKNLIITNQATTDPTNQYNWRFGDGGRSGDVTPDYKYLADKGVFEVCLAIINNAGCISEHCETVVLGNSGIADITPADIFTVYPNPNTGVFNVKVENPSNNLSVSIMDATGKIIKTVSTDMSGVYEVDLSDVASGVYMVQVINGGYSAMQRVTVAK